MSKGFRTSLKPPFLKRVTGLVPADADLNRYPLNLRFFKNGAVDIEFEKKVTIFVGDNGAGKSTLLEGIAAQCGFSLIGGNKNHATYNTETASLAPYLRLAWKPKVTSGFFIRAETMFSFIGAIDSLARDTGAGLYHAYGGKSLAERSHGEAFLSVFENRFGRQGIYILDEPEAALSPERQLDFMRLIKGLEAGDACQIIIATHSVLLMAYPGAQLMRITDSGIRKVQFDQMPHFRILRNFCLDPDAFIEGALLDE